MGSVNEIWLHLNFWSPSLPPIPESMSFPKHPQPLQYTLWWHWCPDLWWSCRIGKRQSKVVGVTQQLRLEGTYRCCPAQALDNREEQGYLSRLPRTRPLQSLVSSTMKNLQLLLAASLIIQLLEIFILQEPYLQLYNWVWVFSGVNCRGLSIKSGFEATTAVPFACWNRTGNRKSSMKPFWRLSFVFHAAVSWKKTDHCYMLNATSKEWLTPKSWKKV